MSAPDDPVEPTLRRTWPQRLLIAFNSIAILAALVTAGAVTWAKQTLGEVPRVQIRSDEFVPANQLAAGDPVNFLIVGTDDADGLDPDDPLLNGRGSVGGTRSDVIMVVRLDPAEGAASIVSFPRDLWVDIPGHGRSRINAAMAYADGEPALLVETLDENFGISINHYLEVNFAAFKGIVDQIGGVRIYISHPLRDRRAHLDLPETGCLTLDSHQALAYARSRHLSWQDDDGRWHSDPTSDLGRIKRQQDFVRRTISQAISKGARNPATLARMVRDGVRHVALDPYTTPQDLIDLGRAFDSFDAEDLVTIELPVVGMNRGGAAVLDLVEPEATRLLTPFRGDPTGGANATFDPSTITVRVANGTGRSNEGARTTDRLADVGFRVRNPRDASRQVQRTTISYHPTLEAEARFVARHLDARPLFVPDTDLVTEIHITTGPDLDGVLDEPRSGDAAPGSDRRDTFTTTTDRSAVSSTTIAPTTTSTTAPTTTTAPPVTDEYVAGAIPPGVTC